MDDETTLFPGELPYAGFFLREDFAVELGFADWMREPYTEERYAKRCRLRKLAFSRMGLEDFNRRRAAYVLPHRMGYYFATAPKAATPVPLIWDGKAHMAVEPDGLFADLVARVKVVMGISETARLPIVPSIGAAPVQCWRFPPAMVVHERRNSRAHLLPLALATTLLGSKPAPERRPPEEEEWGDQ